MTSKMKKQLFNDVVTGLAIAALFAMAAPDAAYADTLNEAVRAAQNNIAEPFAKTVSYVSYVMGAVMMVAGIAGVKKHADQPANEPLNKGLGKIGAGAAFLAAPFVAGMLLETSKETVGSEGSKFTAFEF
ncbi:MAG: hypothetical protein FWF23_06030 [Alphaproteobacteria bacterium]|nr:hypothetical protein [Alphaproteobacteria bacterium]MCL2505641.1 hypothetical protein [Alphaproteobacteria bacterium]